MIKFTVNTFFDIIVHFIIQKLKNKHTFLKKYEKLRKLNPLNLTEREDTKTRYFPPSKSLLKTLESSRSKIQLYVDVLKKKIMKHQVEF